MSEVLGQNEDSRDHVLSNYFGESCKLLRIAVDGEKAERYA